MKEGKILDLRISELYDLSHTAAADYLGVFEYPWEALGGIKEMIISLGRGLDSSEYRLLGENVWVHVSARIAPTAFIGAPCIIGADTEVRHCAFIRGSALIGSGCVVESDKSLVVVKNEGEMIETGLKKFGAMLGDFVEVGCNSVLNPGTVIGRGTNIYPLSCVRGVVPPQSIYKTGGVIVKKS